MTETDHINPSVNDFFLALTITLSNLTEVHYLEGHDCAVRMGDTTPWPGSDAVSPKDGYVLCTISSIQNSSVTCDKNLTHVAVYSTSNSTSSEISTIDVSSRDDPKLPRNNVAIVTPALATLVVVLVVLLMLMCFFAFKKKRKSSEIESELPLGANL